MDLATILQHIREQGDEDVVRAIAESLGTNARGRIDRVIALLVAATGNDTLRLLLENRWSRNEWNDLLTALGRPRRKSFEQIADELASLVDGGGEDEDADDGEGEEDGDVLDDDDPPCGPLPDDVFDFDQAAATRHARPYQQELTQAIADTLRRAPAGSRFRITVATGGGKTRIANDWLARHAIPSRLRVLWITKDWSLLRQAASDLCRRNRDMAPRMGHVGAKGRIFLGKLEASVDRSVVYTTIHTWKSRRRSDFARARFDTIIIDEAHWGEGKRAYATLEKHYRGTSTFLGLTATPRDGTDFELIGKEYGYSELAGLGYLAKHIVEPAVRTGVRWQPTRAFGHGDFDRRSLAEIARSRERNRRIVETYTRNQRVYGKTLVFACDVEHANALRAMFDRAKVAVDAVHSHLRVEDQARVVDRFSTGVTRVLVNVAMMTHGIDIPDIETIFLARPTLSPILFAQMVGRAARLTEGKTHFRIVDFVDNVENHGELLVRPTSFFGQLEPPSSTSREYPRATRRIRHDFKPSAFEHIPRLKGFEEIHGFDVRPGQTFGIEFELTRPDFEQGEVPKDWQNVAEALLAAIPSDIKKAEQPLTQYHAADKRHDVWNVEWDGSCGWEVTSRILEGKEGFFEVVDVCRALDAAAARLGLHVDKRTGTHVHLGWDKNIRTLQRLVRLVAHHESALYTLVAPSRAGNKYPPLPMWRETAAPWNPVSRERRMVVIYAQAVERLGRPCRRRRGASEAPAS